MDVNKNTYTFIFASVLVIVLAAILSFLSVNLSPKQDANIIKEKKQNNQTLPQQQTLTESPHPFLLRFLPG